MQISCWYILFYFILFSYSDIRVSHNALLQNKSNKQFSYCVILEKATSRRSE